MTTIPSATTRDAARELAHDIADIVVAMRRAADAADALQRAIVGEEHHWAAMERIARDDGDAERAARHHGRHTRLQGYHCAVERVRAALLDTSAMLGEVVGRELRDFTGGV